MMTTVFLAVALMTQQPRTSQDVVEIEPYVTHASAFADPFARCWGEGPEDDAPFVGWVGNGATLAGGILAIYSTPLASPEAEADKEPARFGRQRTIAKRRPRRGRGRIANYQADPFSSTRPSANTTGSLMGEFSPVGSSYCGAPTRNGTPCMHLVRGGGRCWQHGG